MRLTSSVQAEPAAPGKDEPVTSGRVRGGEPAPASTRVKGRTAMRERDDSLTASGWPAGGRSGDHPVVREAAEAGRLTGNAAAFLSPTRMFDELHLEESDWPRDRPRDLDRPETQAVMRHLADIARSLDGCLGGIWSQHNVPDTVKPELDAVAGLLMNAGRRLSALTEAPGQGPGSAGPAQQAGQSFPRAPLAGPAGGSERPAARPAGPGPAVKQPKP